MNPYSVVKRYFMFKKLSKKLLVHNVQGIESAVFTALHYQFLTQLD